jgi:hypothetical protein
MKFNHVLDIFLLCLFVIGVHGAIMKSKHFLRLVRRLEAKNQKSTILNVWSKN